MMSRDIPVPSSLTLISTVCVFIFFSVNIFIPDFLSGSAWSAFIMRLITTCSICNALPFTTGKFSAHIVRNVSVWVLIRLSSIETDVMITLLMSILPSRRDFSGREKSLRLSTICFIRREPSVIPYSILGTTFFISGKGNPAKARSLLLRYSRERILTTPLHISLIT